MGGGLFSPQIERQLDRNQKIPSSRDVHDQIEGLTPHWGEGVATGLIIALYGVAMGDGHGIVDVVNIVGPSAFAIVVAISLARLTRLNAQAIWTPLFWYRVAMMTYLGIGSTITLFLNADTRAVLQELFLYFPTDLLKFNMVNALFHECVLLASWVIIRVQQSARASPSSKLLTIEACHLSPQMIGLVLLGIGLATNYLLIYPASFGILNITVPNTVAQFGQAAYVGYFLLTYWGLQNEKYRWVWGMIVLSGIDAIAGTLQLTKYAALFPILMVVIGFIYHRLTMRRLIFAVGFLTLFYMLVASIIYDARDRVERNAGNSVMLADTISILREDIAGTKSDSDGNDLQFTWSRLSYVNAGTLAISLYDQGLPGNSLRDIFVVWIPRIIYHDKPVITDISREFTFLANGNYNSSTNPSLPSEGYWDYGWRGVALFGIVLGLVLTLWSIYSTIVFERGAWHLLLPVLLGMRTGLRVDGMLVPDIIGPLSALLIIHIACQLANRFLPRLPILQRGLA